MTAPNRKDDLSALLADYVLPPGTADELFDGSGQIRPVWNGLMSHLATLPSDALEQRFARGDTYLRDEGVHFRRYGAEPTPEAAWPLSYIPVLIEEQDWLAICAGLRQRADLLEQVMADLYGPARLVTEGHLPAGLIAQNPNWMRPMVGVSPASGHFLHFLAFEISRNPDGSWFVLGDRTQAPSGAGFALENRMATARIFPEPELRANVTRMARFFRAFREGLEGMAAGCGGQPAILTPGPGTDTYFEHMYIARYLGLMLLEGEDMTVQNGQLMVRTVAGPAPLGALWRRLDSEFADPLELDETSYLGTPGLMHTIRNGRLGMANALGSGVLEMRAMMAFLPKISEVLTGTPLTLPNIATWWCGDPEARDYVDTYRDAMMISDALATGPAFEERIEAPKLPARQVGQEMVTLSTAPAWQDGHLVPRPMSVRVFAARTDEGWTFLPGGYARIGHSGDASALAMQKGGSVADVWIIGDRPAPRETLLTPGQLPASHTGALPSRAADNLFWMGRYIERAESALRLIRAYHLRLEEIGAHDDPRLDRIKAQLAQLGMDITQPIPPALDELFSAAQGCAGKVRDSFSIDGWNALSDLAKTVRQHRHATKTTDDLARIMGRLLHQTTGFTGLVHENMYRGSGWRFLSFGRALERADALASALILFTDPEAEPGNLDLALEFGDSTMSHRRYFRVEASRETVLSLLALDTMNPRAILFQIQKLREIAGQLPQGAAPAGPSDLSRLIMPLETRLMVAKPAEIVAEDLHQIRGDLARISNHLTSLYLR